MELANQLTRLLAARTADEAPRSTHLAAALESLSLFDFVGLHEQPPTYLEPLEELLGTPFQPESDQPPAEAHEIAGILRGLPVVEELLDTDIILYNTVRDALAENS